MSRRRPEAPEDRVVISGYGTVDAAGCGADALGALFSSESPRLREIDREAGYHRRDSARSASLVDPASLVDWLPARRARRMSPPSRFAVVAASIAWQDAGLEPGGGDDQTAVVTSTTYGPSSYTEALLRQILQGDPTQASPFLFTEAVANAPAAQIALLLKARGPNITITQREIGPLAALAKGAAEIRAGRARRVLVAAVEEANPLLHAALDRFGVLAGSRGREEIARPFDRDRHGYHLGEGATALVLEKVRDAEERGVPTLGVLGPWVGAFDATAGRAGFGHGAELLAGRLVDGLGREGVEPDGVDLVISGACGGRSGDGLAARVLHTLWPDTHEMPPIFVPKAHACEHGGGLLSGLVAALLRLEVAPPPGFRTPDPALGITPFAGGKLPAARRILTGSLAVGGSAAWMVVESTTGDE